jgi:DNA-binding MarR family transcriptional regulator
MPEATAALTSAQAIESHRRRGELAQNSCAVEPAGCILEPMATEMVAADALALQAHMVALVRAFGWHRPEHTPCGQPVPISDAHALMELGRQDSLAQHELGARLGLEKSTISRLVHQLEERGWVERQCLATDGRVTLLALTSAGRQANDQLTSARAAFFARVLERVPDDKRHHLLECLDLLVGALHADR